MKKILKFFGKGEKHTPRTFSNFRQSVSQRSDFYIVNHPIQPRPGDYLDSDGLLLVVEKLECSMSGAKHLVKAQVLRRGLYQDRQSHPR